MDPKFGLKLGRQSIHWLEDTSSLLDEPSCCLLASSRSSRARSHLTCDKPPNLVTSLTDHPATRALLLQVERRGKRGSIFFSFFFFFLQGETVRVHDTFIRCAGPYCHCFSSLQHVIANTAKLQRIQNQNRWYKRSLTARWNFRRL